MSIREFTESEKIILHVKTMIKFVSTDEMKKLKAELPGNCRAIAMEKFEKFFERHPSLFNMIFDDPANFEMSRLVKMLELKDKCDNNEISMETATKDVGQEYFDEFVVPNIDQDKETETSS